MTQTFRDGTLAHYLRYRHVRLTIGALLHALIGRTGQDTGWASLRLGFMFWLRQNTLVGSYLSLRATSRCTTGSLRPTGSLHPTGSLRPTGAHTYYRTNFLSSPQYYLSLLLLPINTELARACAYRE